jgi:V/A-type H+-transporting ATPase subunit C
LSSLVAWLNPYAYQFWVIIGGILVAIIGIIARPLSSYFKFIYPNAKYQTIGNPFITKKELDKILDSKNLQAFVENVNYLRDYNIEGKDAKEIQLSLDKNLFQTIEMMRKDSSRSLDSFYDAYLEKFDMQYVRIEIKEALTRVTSGKEEEKETAEEPKCLLEKNKRLILKIREIKDRDSLKETLIEYGFEKSIVDNLLVKEELDFMLVDVMVDKYIINHLKEIKLPYRCNKPVELYVKTLTDILNIKNILRAKYFEYDFDTCKKLFLGEGREIAEWLFNNMIDVKQVSQVISVVEGTSYFKWLRDAIEDYNKENSVQPLENALDACLIELMKNISVEYYLTMGPLLRFIVSKEYEIRNLKIIAKGIAENVKPETIKKLLVTVEETGGK